jgi:uncharacterized membrane protein|tara:strand:- start:535 stop:1668 length:1134 start_codon:yes stop_codon:yes gene_type:complete
MENNWIAIIIIIITFFLIRFIEKSKNRFSLIFSKWIPPILLAFIFPAIIVYLFGLNFDSSPIFSWNTRYLYPITIFTIMSSMSFSDLKIVGLKPLILFLISSFIITIVPVVLILLIVYNPFDYQSLIIENSLWKGFVPVIGSWIGGSSSMLVLKEFVLLNEELFLSVLVIDTIIQNIVMIFLFQSIKQTDYIDKKFNLDKLELITLDENNLVSKNLTFTLFFSFSIPLIFIYLDIDFLFNILALSILGLFFGNFFKSWSNKINLKIGSIGIILIMSIIGLKLTFDSFELPFEFVIFIIFWMLINIILITLTGFLLKTSFTWTPIALMANIGGISTCPALASAYNKKLMPHAIVLAILSMATGTFWGILSFTLIKFII